jgi:pantoate--beta-alanine ligase
MEVAKTIAAVRKTIIMTRKQGKRIGLVPTMGALHKGHVSLIEAAREDCDFVVVSIFVNPTQFAPGEDLEKYPRPIERDLEICQEHGVDLVFAPAVQEMYPTQNLTWVTVERLTEPLCGRYRPGHFRGVATVCAKLFNIIQPHVAFFGQKDAQQAIVIKRMVADLNMPLEIVVCPTVRQEDGLALSSRNDYLSEQERNDATCIYRSLQKAKELIEAGVKDTTQILAAMRAIIEQVPSMRIEYVSIVDSQSLQNVEQITGDVLVAVAAGIGQARLIDNILVDSPTQ